MKIGSVDTEIALLIIKTEKENNASKISIMSIMFICQHKHNTIQVALLWQRDCATRLSVEIL